MPTWWNEPTGHDAFVLSWVSLVVTLAASVGGIVAYYKLDSSLILVYGLENIVDFISSVIVLWRFYLPPSSDAAEEARLLSREKRASVGVSILLAVLGFGTIISSVEDFAGGLEEEDLENLNVIYYVSLVSIFVFGLMAVIKLQYANKLNSSSLRKDGVNSAMGAVLAVSLFFNSSMAMASNGSLWWLDPLVAISCGIASFVYGMKGIYKAYVKEGIPIWSRSWWLYGGGSGMNGGDQKDLDFEIPATTNTAGAGNSRELGSRVPVTTSSHLPNHVSTGVEDSFSKTVTGGQIGNGGGGGGKGSGGGGYDETLNGNDDVEDIALT